MEGGQGLPSDFGHLGPVGPWDPEARKSLNDWNKILSFFWQVNNFRLYDVVYAICRRGKIPTACSLVTLQRGWASRVELGSIKETFFHIYFSQKSLLHVLFHRFRICPFSYMSMSLCWYTVICAGCPICKEAISGGHKLMGQINN